MTDTPQIIKEIARCQKWMEAALDYSGGTHTIKDVIDGILSARMQLWAGEKGCAVTEIVAYPKKKVLHVFLAGGDMDQIVDMQESAEAWGKAQGCTAMTIAGRAGWKRVLADYGYKEQFVTLSKEI